jgi:hypothetical protein
MVALFSKNKKKEPRQMQRTKRYSRARERKVVKAKNENALQRASSSQAFTNSSDAYMKPDTNLYYPRAISSNAIRTGEQ